MGRHALPKWSGLDDGLVESALEIGGCVRDAGEVPARGEDVLEVQAGVLYVTVLDKVSCSL